MTATAVHPVPILPPHQPQIWAALNPGHNSAIDQTLARGGMFAMVKEFAQPAFLAGCAHILFRYLRWPREWVCSLYEAMGEFCPTATPVIYMNPRQSGMDLAMVRQASVWRGNGGKIIVETDNDYLWARSLLRADAIEPAVGNQDGEGVDFQVILEDHEWKYCTTAAAATATKPAMVLKDGWNENQIAPWNMPRGFSRWHARGVFDNGLGVLDGLKAHYAACAAYANCHAQVIAADLFTIPAYGLTVDAIRGVVQKSELQGMGGRKA